MKTGFSKASRYVLVAAAFVIVIAGMKQAAPLLIPFLLSIFVAVLCLPVIHALKGYGLSQAVALSIVVLSIFVFGLMLAMLIGGSINDFSAALPTYQDKISVVNERFIEMLRSNGFSFSQDAIREQLDASSIMQGVSGIVTGFGSVLANSFLIFVSVIFILLESGRFAEKIAIITDKKNSALYNDFSEKLRLYMGIKTWMSLATGLLVSAWLWFLDVDYPELWGLLAFLLNYVPNIGSIIAAAPAVLLALVQFDLEIAALVLVGYAFINILIGNFVEPRFLGKELDLSTLVVFLSLVFWGWVLGPVGMVLSVPLTISVKLALDENEDTQWLGILLGR